MLQETPMPALADLSRLGLNALVRQAMSSGKMRGTCMLFVTTRRGWRHHVMSLVRCEQDEMLLQCYDAPPVRIACDQVAVIEMQGHDKAGKPFELRVA